MTGDDHYRAAEDVLAGIDWADHSPELIRAQAEQAQAHATLALAAATAGTSGTQRGHYGGWPK